LFWFAEKRPVNLLTEEDAYGLRQTGHAVFSSQPDSAVCRVTSLPLLILLVALNYLTK